MRTQAKNDFEKDFFKLMNNSVFGKTMENVKKRCNVQLETDREHVLKLTSDPYYTGCKIFSENLVAVKMKKREVTLNKAIYVGVCILDISKTLMYDFHYNFIKNKYGDKAKLTFTDTDSLCYLLETEDVYEDLDKYRDMFDNSAYDKDPKYYFGENKKVIGKMKDECNGKPIIEFVGLKSKMYAHNTEEKEEKKAKGVKEYVKKKVLKLEDYKKTLRDSKIIYHEMKSLRSDHHEIYAYKINKISLSCYDDKRYILDDAVSSYTYGRYKI